jgi:hypothetical protein
MAAGASALACSKPPKGRARWTLRLLENKVVELGIDNRPRTKFWRIVTFTYKPDFTQKRELFVGSVG